MRELIWPALFRVAKIGLVLSAGQEMVPEFNVPQNPHPEWYREFEPRRQFSDAGGRSPVQFKIPTRQPDGQHWFNSNLTPLLNQRS